MRIYVIGPVSGFDDLNQPAFEAARESLSDAGFTPLIPHDFVASDADWRQAMRRSIETLVKADGIAYLDGWKESNGAYLEWKIARRLGIDVAAVDSWCAVGAERASQAARGEQIKRCPSCKRELPAKFFDRSAGSKDEMQGYCRDCMEQYKRERMKK